MADDTSWMHDPRVVAFHAARKEAVRLLGDEIGYGAVMTYAEQLWREKQPGIERTCGPCASLMEPCPCVEQYDEKIETDDDDDVSSWRGCDWCGGAGRVTKRVRAAIRQSQNPPTKETST